MIAPEVGARMFAFRSGKGELKRHFPQIALALGLILALLLYRFGPQSADGDSGMPLLTALFVAEFGFLLTAGAAVATVLTIRREVNTVTTAGQLGGSLLLAAAFAYLGLTLWNAVAA